MEKRPDFLDMVGLTPGHHLPCGRPQVSTHVALRPEQHRGARQLPESQRSAALRKRAHLRSAARAEADARPRGGPAKPRAQNAAPTGGAPGPPYRARRSRTGCAGWPRDRDVAP